MERDTGPAKITLKKKYWDGAKILYPKDDFNTGEFVDEECYEGKFKEETADVEWIKKDNPVSRRKKAEKEAEKEAEKKRAAVEKARQEHLKSFPPPNAPQK